jgi:hypothetical protein
MRKMEGASAFVVVLLVLACTGSALKATGHGGQSGSNGLGAAFSFGGSALGGVTTGGGVRGSGGSPAGGAGGSAGAGGSDASSDLGACVPSSSDDAGLGECPCVTQLDDVMRLNRTACDSIGLECYYSVPACGALCTCGPGDGDNPAWSCLVPLCP